MAKHNNYDTSFKQNAVEYYYDHKEHMSVKEITDYLGIAQSTLHKWVKAHAEGAIEVLKNPSGFWASNYQWYLWFNN